MSEEVSFVVEHYDHEQLAEANEQLALIVARLNAENAKLREQLADVTVSMGRVEERCAKLRELCRRFAEYVSQDRCEGCVYKSRCNDGLVDECWQRTEIRKMARELGVEIEA